MNILNKILETKREEVSLQKRLISAEELEARPLYQRNRFSMSKALISSPYGIIAEFKRKSPSKGFIHEKADPAAIVPGYATAGAAACSILTDNTYFGGSTNDLTKVRALVNIPLLRKEFIIDPYQIKEAAAIGADAILLIAAALEIEQCHEYAEEARSLGLEVLLEVHNEKELKHINSSVNMVGINNRDLTTFVTDIQTSVRLNKMIPDGYIRVSESGIMSRPSRDMLRKEGFRGFLIGECFMKETDPADALRKFLSDDN